MLKPTTSLLEPDPRYLDLVFHSFETGEKRPVQIDDLRRMVVSIELNSGVPPTIIEEFDIARHAFVYSWFVYEFATLAEQKVYAVLEMAFRERLDPDAIPNTTRSPGLNKLIKTAIAQGQLKKHDYEVTTFPGSEETMCLLDYLPMLRNHVMHGNIQLFPQGTPEVLRLCAEIINKLFDD